MAEKFRGDEALLNSTTRRSKPLLVAAVGAAPDIWLIPAILLTNTTDDPRDPQFFVDDW